MRIMPNLARLRVIALACWAIGAWCILQSGLLATQHGSLAPLLGVSTAMLGILLFALGVGFWPLGNDRQANITFDAKGLQINLGYHTAYIAWDMIERVGVTTHRSSVMALGSTCQLGIALRVAQPYLQSYEERLPAARGALSSALWALAWRPVRREDAALAALLTANRAATGYDVLVPEAFLGGQAQRFAELVEYYHRWPSVRRTLR